MKNTLRIVLAAAVAALTLCVSSCVPSDYERIAEDGATQYRIVRSDTSDVGGAAAAKIRKAIEEAIGSKVEIMSDFEHEKLGTMRIDTEILVGPTNRDESNMHEREFTYYDYAIDFDTTRISITGGSSAALEKAADYFEENFVFKDKGVVALPKGTVTEYFHDYPVKTVTIGGKPIEEYVIISSPNDGRAKDFANSFYSVYGKAPRVEEFSYKEKSDCEIILSSALDPRYQELFASLKDFESMYKVEGTKVYIGTNGSVSDQEAWGMFVGDLFANDFALLSGDIVITDCHRSESLPTAKNAEADEALFADVDVKSAALKDAIMNSENLEIPENAVVYYVSPNGDDSNDGRSPETPWKTLGKVNALDYPGKAYILFERGGLWRGQISAKARKIYSAYGEGAKPMLYGGHEDGAIPEKWTLLEGTDNIWVYKDEMIDSGTLVFNGGEEIAYKEIPSYVDGRFVKRSDHTQEFDIIEALDVDLDFFHKADSVLTNNAYPTSGTAKGELYLRCDRGNPGEVFESIEFVPRRNGFALAGDDVTIDNFTIKYIGAHGIGGGSRNGLTVTNCEIGWIGGGIQSYAANGDTNQTATRYGNGIEIYVSCKDFTVDHCYVYQVYDAGVTHQFKGDAGKIVKQENVVYSNNLIENCVYSIEYFLDASEEPEQSMYNIKIFDNIMRYCGFGWGNQRPNKGSQAHIKGWDHDNPAVGFDIYNNIFDRSTNWMIHCGYDLIESEPKIYGNTFIQYKDGMFGRYMLNPTKVMPYNSYMLADERLLDNTFYFVNESVPRYVGDRGALAVLYNDMRIYEDGEVVELHGERITDAAELARIKDAFAKAEQTAAIFAGLYGDCKDGVVEENGITYEKFETCTTMAELEERTAQSFDEELTAKLMATQVGEGKMLFVEKDAELYRFGGYAGQYGYDSADCEIVECTVDKDGVVSIHAHISFTEGTFKKEFDTLYKCVKDENGEYKFVSAFECPMMLVLIALNS